MRELKYIITRKGGQTRHFKFPSCYHHETFSRDNGYDYFSQVIESGLIIEGNCVIVTCKDKIHLERRERKQLNTLGNNYLKAREIESLYSYRYVGLREGD
jgi:hypothetical protein